MASLPDNPEAFPLRRAYDFLEMHGLPEEAQAIRTSQDRFGSYTSTLKRGKVIALLQEKGLLDQFIARHWVNGETEKGKRLIKSYESIYQRFLAEPDVDTIVEADNDIEDTQFAYETDLRDYLSRTLPRLESGLTLWPISDGQKAIEYPIDGNGRRIDILAKDSNGTPVVIELKVSKGHERTIGQALYYRGRVKELFGTEAARVIIVAREISAELSTATRDLEWVSLFEYRLSMTWTRVQ